MPELKTPPDLEPWEKWRHKPLSQRMTHIARVLERVAALGSEDAAKSWLAHARWEQEFKKGRAPQRRVDAGEGISITIVDDITGKRAVRIQQGQPQQVAQLPSPHEPMEEKDEEEGNVRE